MGSQLQTSVVVWVDSDGAMTLHHSRIYLSGTLVLENFICPNPVTGARTWNTVLDSLDTYTRGACTCHWVRADLN